MKLAVAALCVAPALAFAPAATFGTRRSALNAVATSDVRTNEMSCCASSEKERVQLWHGQSADGLVSGRFALARWIVVAQLVPARSCFSSITVI